MDETDVIKDIKMEENYVNGDLTIGENDVNEHIKMDENDVHGDLTIDENDVKVKVETFEEHGHNIDVGINQVDFAQQGKIFRFFQSFLYDNQNIQTSMNFHIVIWNFITRSQTGM